MPRAHEWIAEQWFMNGTVSFCRVCGFVKRRDGQDKPCKGPVKLTLRKATGLSAKQVEKS